MIKGFFQGICTLLGCVVLAFVGVNAAVMVSSLFSITSYQDAFDKAGSPQAHDAEAQTLRLAGSLGLGPEEVSTCDALVVLGASVLPDGTLSPILKNRVDAAIDLYFQGVAPVVIMSGDGRSEHYNEPFAMKEYAIAAGVPSDAIYCDPGGHHTYDTMWRVKNVYGAQNVCVVTQEYHLYRAVFDAWGVGMDAHGVVSDEGTYDDQLWYDVREACARVSDVAAVITKDIPENPTEEITL